MPDVSPDGRTYTFTVRPGYRFSPPSNEPSRRRHSAIRSNVQSLDWAGTAGHTSSPTSRARSSSPGDADHISGLRANGDTLTIELAEPSPTSWSASPSRSSVRSRPTRRWCRAVPGAYAGYPHRAPLAVPSAGPYYIADHLDGEYTILKRNPNYTGPRPHAFDAIVLREGVDPGIAVGLVENGAWDGISHVFDPLLTPQGRSPRSTGPRTRPRGVLLLRDAAPLTGFFAFNASRPPFSDPDVRRAAALAIDREAIAAIWGNAPTDQFLPPVMPGFEDRSCTRWTDPASRRHAP